MSHILLTQIKDTLETPIVVKCSDVSYSNPSNDNPDEHYITLSLTTGTVSIRVIEDAQEIYEKIKESNATGGM